MSIVNLTKQFAEQTISKQLKNVIDPAAATTETLKKPEPHFGELLIGQLQTMQNSLKEDQELHVNCTVGKDTVRVLEIYVPSWPLLVITGANVDRAIVRVVTHTDAAQFVCKVVKVPAEAKPQRINCILPKAD